MQILSDARLITVSEDTVEVAHEALIREWPTLREWLNSNRESLRLHRQVGHDADEWQRLNRDDGMLYRGARLAQALEWAEGARQATELNALEREFLRAAKELAEREEVEREAQRQRELEAAQKLVATEKQAAARLRTRNRIITAVGILALFAAITAIWFGIQSNQNAITAQIANTQSAQNLNIANENAATAQAASTLAIAQSRITLARQLAAQAEQILTSQAGRLSRALLLGIESARRYPEYDNNQILANGLDLIAQLLPGDQVAHMMHDGPVYSVAFSPNGQWVVSGSRDGTVRVWEASTGKEVARMISNSKFGTFDD